MSFTRLSWIPYHLKDLLVFLYCIQQRPSRIAPNGDLSLIGERTMKKQFCDSVSLTRDYFLNTCVIKCYHYKDPFVRSVLLKTPQRPHLQLKTKCDQYMKFNNTWYNIKINKWETLILKLVLKNRRETLVHSIPETLFTLPFFETIKGSLLHDLRLWVWKAVTEQPLKFVGVLMGVLVGKKDRGLDKDFYIAEIGVFHQWVEGEWPGSY